MAVVGVITIIFLTYFMLLEGPRTIKGTLGLLPPQTRVRYERVGYEIYRTISGYVTWNLLISLAAAGVFAATLWRPPSLIERFALASGEPWSAGLRFYCRNVTLIWAAWIVVSAAIAAHLALSNNDAAWALWTGLLSYLVSGALFAGEWMVRRTLAPRQPR